MNKKEDVLRRVARTGFTFLISDLDLAMTLVRIAAELPPDNEKKIRNQQNARRAYEAVLRLSESMPLTSDEQAEVNEKLGRLKAALEGLGDSFGSV